MGFVRPATIFDFLLLTFDFSYIYPTMNDTDRRWIKIAESPEELSFAANHIALVETEERTICIARHGEQLYAFTPKCPHASGPLSEGWIDAVGNLVCPLHRYKFSLKNGRNSSGEGYFLKNWPVRVDDSGVYVGFEKKGLLGLL